MLFFFSLDEEGWQWGGRVEARRSRDTIVDKHTHRVLFLALYQDLGGMFLEGERCGETVSGRGGWREGRAATITGARVVR